MQTGELLIFLLLERRTNLILDTVTGKISGRSSLGSVKILRNGKSIGMTSGGYLRNIHAVNWREIISVNGQSCGRMLLV